MDIASRIASAGGEDISQVGVSMLKKAQDSQASTAAQLIANIPQVRSANAPGQGGGYDGVG